MLIKIICYGFFTFITTIVLIVLLATLGIFGKMPSLESLENPQSDLASEIWSEDNILLGTFYKENRSYTLYNDISVNVVNALIATEDKRFYNHYGIDFKRMLSSLIFTILGYKQGGSTISQQLALNLYDKRSSNNIVRVIQKIKEIITAVQLERYYTKQEIIALYLNTVNYGNNSYGIKMAAYSFFGLMPNELSINQSALLIGLINAPTRYSPIKNYKNSLYRRNIVLSLMYKNNYITKDELDKYSKEDIILNLTPTLHDEGIAPYFREILRLNIKDIILHDSIMSDIIKYNEYDIYRDGLKIYTTINYKMQKYAEEALKEHLSYLQLIFEQQSSNQTININDETILKYIKQSPIYRDMVKDKYSMEDIKNFFIEPKNMNLFSWYHPNYEYNTLISPLNALLHLKKHLIGSMLSIDPNNGSIKVWVGGINYKYFKFDMVKNGKRQLGSIFKPIVYTEAIENFNFKPSFKIPNIPITFENYKNEDGNVYTPYNADYSIGGMYTLYEGFVKSLNTATMYLVKQIGPDNIIKRALNMGINANFQPYPSIGLGVFESSLYDIVEAYSAFFNKGIKNSLFYINYIKDRNGNIIYINKNISKEVMKEETSYDILEMLKGTVQSDFGTARRLRLRYGFKNSIGAKTGTTDNQSDGWFIGGLPNLLTGIWVGGDNKTLYWDEMRDGQGANTALPIWALYTKKIYSDKTLLFYQKNFDDI